MLFIFHLEIGVYHEQGNTITGKTQQGQVAHHMQEMRKTRIQHQRILRFLRLRKESEGKILYMGETPLGMMIR
jgi:hypothetical protein